MMPVTPVNGNTGFGVAIDIDILSPCNGKLPLIIDSHLSTFTIIIDTAKGANPSAMAYSPNGVMVPPYQVFS